MRLDLYTSGVSLTVVSSWVDKISVVARMQGIRVLHVLLNDRPEVLQEKLPLVFDELCTPPEQQMSISGCDESILHTLAYRSYHSGLAQGWNLCLHCPSRDAIGLSFNNSLLARKAVQLYLQEGTSDKVYHLYLAQFPRDAFYSVISRYGRVGGTLQHTERTFDCRLDQAEKEWNRLHQSKVRKGYQIGRPGVAKQLGLDLSSSEIACCRPTGLQFDFPIESCDD